MQVKQYHVHVHVDYQNAIPGVPKNDPTCFCPSFVKSPPNLILFWQTDSQDDRNM